MSRLMAALREHAATRPDQAALQDEIATVTYGELLKEVEHLSEVLRRTSPRALGLLAENSCAWVAADLAAYMAGIPLIPLPPFFSPAQIRHVTITAGLDQVLTDRPGRLKAFLQVADLPHHIFSNDLARVELPSRTAPCHPIPAGTLKVTFTSGTTGEPKGVCLGQDLIEMVAESLRLAADADRDDRHLCLLPLSTLLENIGGVYTPLLAGATACVPRLSSIGFAGSSALDARRLITAMGEWDASTGIVVPQILQAIVEAGTRGICMPSTLRYLAVGGAPVSERLLRKAQALGIPVFQGYGLSECGSVVAVNRAGANRIGSVGQPLPHVQLEFADDGEIIVRGLPSLGYLGEPRPSSPPDFISTGDLGYRDAEGFVHITGRKKDIFITSFGRNVAPEWVECELTSRPAIRQAAVFGEGRHFNSAVIVPQPAASRSAIEAELQLVNERLPDYARVREWIAANEPFTPDNGMLTFGGGLRRSSVYAAYSEQIDALYQRADTHTTP